MAEARRRNSRCSRSSGEDVAGRQREVPRTSKALTAIPVRRLEHRDGH